jgi:hypothetical protein
MAPADPILGLSEAFQMDADPNKVNLGVGAYRGDDGKPYVLPSVREAEKRMLAAEHNHEYLPIVGLKSYTDLALGFAYGEDSPALTEGRVAAMQTLSGTGSLRLATEYFKRFHDGGALYVPNPTWGNHIPIAQHSGLEVRKYSYFDPSTVGLDFAGMLDDVNAAPENSIFLLHACAHNPTGIDPSSEQWAELANLMKKKNHLTTAFALTLFSSCFFTTLYNVTTATVTKANVPAQHADPNDANAVATARNERAKFRPAYRASCSRTYQRAVAFEMSTTKTLRKMSHPITWTMVRTSCSSRGALAARLRSITCIPRTASSLRES